MRKKTASKIVPEATKEVKTAQDTFYFQGKKIVSFNSPEGANPKECVLEDGSVIMLRPEQYSKG